MIDLNLNSMNIDDSGRVSFSGLSSGIDFRAAVDAIIAARRIPVDTLETRITENDDKLLALNELKSRLNVLRESVATLYGKLSVGYTDNVFRSKLGFSSTSRIDGGSASSAANLLGVTVANSAASGSHTVEILRTAAAHKVSSDPVASLSAGLGFADGDQFTLNGATVTVSAGDTILDLRDRINNANSGGAATGVTASVVTVSASEHYLVLTGDDAATTITMADTVNTPLNTIGLLNGGAIKNELQANQTAQFYVDGLLDMSNTRYESDLQASASVTVSTSGTLDFGGAGTVAYTAGEDLTTIAANIDALVGINASVVSDGAGVRLDISSGAAFAITEVGGGNLISEFGVNQSRLIAERDSNTITDLFNGVTLSLFQAEQGTTIRIDIEHDVNAVKDAITTFVESYNELRTYINSQRRLDEGSPIQAEDSGVLFASSALREADSLSRILGDGTPGVNDAFQVLSQIGVNFIDNRNVIDPVLSNTLTIDEATLDEAILNNLDDVRRLFAFDFSSSDPRVSILSFDENTVYNASGYTLNVASSGTYDVPPGPGATNQIVYSENFDDAYYTVNKATVSADTAATLDPAGGNDADALTLDTTTGAHYVETGALAVTAGQTYTYSVYVKQGSTDEVKLDLSGSGITGTDATATFDLAGGTLVDVGTDLDGATITADANGFYRVTITATADATGSVTIKNQASDSGLGDSFLGDGSDAIYLYGSQFENTTAEAPQPMGVYIANFGTVNIDADLDPNFGAGAEVFDATGAMQIHSVETETATTINVTNGEQYSYSVYLKAGNETNLQLSLSDVGLAFAAGTTANFDVTAGTGTVTAIGAGADSATIEPAGNDYYRVTLTATAAATTTSSVATIAGRDGTAYAGVAGGDFSFYEPTIVDTSTTAPTAYERTGIYTGTPNTVISANINGLADGSDDGSASVTGGTVTINTGGAQGLILSTAGFTAATSVQLDFTVGVGAQLFFALDQMLDFKDGIVANEIENINETNDFQQERIDSMLERLELRRRDLIDRFIRMETALATMNRILENVRRDADAMFANR